MRKMMREKKRLASLESLDNKENACIANITVENKSGSVSTLTDGMSKFSDAIFYFQLLTTWLYNQSERNDHYLNQHESTFPFSSVHLYCLLDTQHIQLAVE